MEMASSIVKTSLTVVQARIQNILQGYKTKILGNLTLTIPEVPIPQKRKPPYLMRRTSCLPKVTLMKMSHPMVIQVPYTWWTKTPLLKRSLLLRRKVHCDLYLEAHVRRKPNPVRNPLMVWCLFQNKLDLE